MLLEMSLQQWLGLSLAGAVVTTVGSLVATVLKEFFFTRSFDRWRRHQDRLATYERFRDPLAVSAIELANRLIEITDQYPPAYLKRSVFVLRPDKQMGNDASDPYFQHYKLVSTIYRFACLFGWLELYRQETTFLRVADERKTRALQDAVTAIRGDVADGHINAHEDWRTWHDTLIFREELRALGEAMIETRGQSRSIMGYGTFRDCVESEQANAVHRVCGTIMNFTVDAQDIAKDFRRERLVRLLAHLVDLIELLSPAALNSRLRTARKKALSSTTAWPKA
jgi:hypothetical protein